MVEAVPQKLSNCRALTIGSQIRLKSSSQNAKKLETVLSTQAHKTTGGD